MPNDPKGPHEGHDSDGPVTQHLHDETKNPVKAPSHGVPPNISGAFPAKGGKNFNQLKGGGRNFRHQGR